MWSGDGRRPRAASSRGYTLVECAIVMVIIAMVSIILNGAVASTHEADRYLQAVRTASERGQKLALEVSSLVNASRKLFQGDDVGDDYLEALDLTRDPMAPGSRLPEIVEDDVPRPDVAGEPKTGNVLLFVRESDPAPCVSNPAAGTIRNIDTYRFVCIYPHQTQQTLAAGKPDARDLIVWRSDVFPSYAQIMEILDATQRTNVIKDLHERYGYRTAWDPTQPVAAAFYTFNASGVMAAAPTANFVVPEDLDVSERGRLVYAHLQLARTDPNFFDARAILTVDDPLVFTPDGFEVKVTGASRSRQIWLHIVVEAPEAGGQKTSIQACTVTTNCQDM